jgi:hypothetical protein
MMQLVPGSKRMFADDRTDPVEGRVRWAPAKSLWIGTMTLAAVVFGPLAFSWDAFVLFIATSAVTLCFGHSVGMHRRLIHESFECPLWLEHLCVYLGTLVGMAGPIGMVRLHDFRDWAQRQSACHDYSCHRAGFWRDAWWQLHCRLALEHPPLFRPEPRIANDRFYSVIERTWMLQQLPWAVLFYAIGGMSWVVWGICVRASVCVTGRPFRPSLRQSDLYRGGRGRPGLQRRGRRAHQHGRGLAQQPPCLSRIRQDGSISRPDGSRLVADQDVRGLRPRDQRQDAGESSVQARTAPLAASG